MERQNTATIQTPGALSPPEILAIDLCKNGEEIDELMFGQTADAVVRIRSSRQIEDATASLEQFWLGCSCTKARCYILWK